jgi:putative ABC transport system permease protein
MALDHVRADYRRVVLSVLAVTVGVALVVAVLVMNESVLASFTATIDDLAGRSHLTISAGDDASFPEALVERVAAVPGVKLAVPLVSSFAFPDDESGRLLSVFGIDLANDAQVRVYHHSDDSKRVIDDFLEFLSQPDSVVLSRDYAEENGLHLDDEFKLLTPHGVSTFTVRGLLDPQGLARTLGGRLVIMDLPAAQHAFAGDGQVNQIDVLLFDPTTVDSMKAALRDVLPDGMKVEEPMVRKSATRRTLQGLQALLAAVAILCVLAGLLICYSRLSAVFDARTWEIGLMRAVGLSRGVVAFELLKEALVLGLIGAAVGIPVGLILAGRALPSVEAFVTTAYRVPLFGTETDVRVRAVLIGAMVGVISTMLAALGPSVRLARTEPIAALRMRGRAPGFSWGLGRWYVTAGLLVSILIALTLQLMTNVAGLGQVATALMALTTCAVGPPFVSMCSRALARVAPRPLSTGGHFALEQIAQDPRRSGLAVATLGLGVGVVLFLGLLAHSTESTLVTLFSESLRADLIVSSQLQQASYRSSPLGNELVQHIAAVQGVAAVSGEQSKDQQHDGSSVVLKSFDASAFTTPTLYKWPLAAGALPDALERVVKGEAILVTRSFAFQTRKRPGDTVKLESPSGPMEFLVAGIATGQVENAIVLSRDVYRKLWNDDDVYLIHVAVEPGVGAERVQRTIEQLYGQRYRIKIRTGPDLVAHIKGEVHKGFALFYILDSLILVLVVIAIGDTLASAVIERTREFGLLRAVGIPKLSISVIVLAEGMVLAAFGLVVALASGLSMGAFWVIVQFPATLGVGIDLHVPIGFVCVALALAMLLSIVGSLVPSMRAARLSVVQALRQE